MTDCELCGKNPGAFHCEVEGTMMNVCTACSKFGKVKGSSNVRIVVKEKPSFVTREPVYVFIPGFGSRVKNARERMKLTQEEFAKKLNERESMLHQIESEHFKPGVELAKKLEHLLHIQILEEVSEKETHMDEKSKKSASSGPLTIGDMLNVRKK